MFSDDVSLQNEELKSASKLGDVMKVVSLLNSGANVLTKDKVVCTSLSTVYIGIGMVPSIIDVGL